jgi:hypothetical protein
MEFFQISHAVNRQLFGIAVPGGRQAFEICANSPPGICNSFRIKGARQLVVIQNAIDDVIHRELRNKRTATTAVQHFAFQSSSPPE